ncbi:MAG: hypothetical protein AB8B61_00310 [Cyclobacteriaceae bacterium]
MSRLLFLYCLITYFVVFFLLGNTSVYSQNGDLFLSNFEAPSKLASTENFAIVHDGQDRIRFANRKGILTYDGNHWSLLPTPSTPLSFAYNKKADRIYVGCLKGFGYLRTSDNGTEDFVSIGFKDEASTPLITKIITTENTLYFLGDDKVYCYNQENNKVSIVTNDSIDGFSDIFSFEETLFLSSNDGYLFTLKDSSLTLTNTLPNESPITCTNLLSDSSILLGNEKNELFVYANNSFSPFTIKSPDILKNSQLFSIESFSDSLLILSTHLSGAIIINRYTTETYASINYFTGLPDNEIIAATKDNFGGIWMSHSYGFTRLDAQLPFKTYSNYSGLEGHINTVTSFGGTTYVGTSQGIYYLDKIEDFSLVNKVIKLKEEAPSLREEQEIREEEKEEEKSLFTSLFGKKKSRKKKLKKRLARVERKERSRTTNTKAKARYISTKEKILHSVSHGYRKIKEIKSSCKKFYIHNGELLAVTNQGVYSINKSKTNRLFNHGSRCSLLSQDGVLYFITYDNKLHRHEKKRGKWVSSYVSKPFNFKPSYLYTHGESLWICGKEQVIQMPSTKKPTSKRSYKVNNPFSDEVWMTTMNDQLLLVLQSSVLVFNAERNSFKKDTSYNEILKKPHQFIHSQHHLTWLYANEDWTPITDLVSKTTNFKLFTLLPRIKTILKERDSYWVITKNDEIYYFTPSSTDIRFNHGKQIYLSEVKNKKGSFLSFKNLRLEHNDNNIEFVYYIPNYLSNYKLSYQYLIKGIGDENWSSWSNDRSVKLSGLLPGKYVLKMRVRNMFNEVNEGNEISFIVSPPYWKTNWFYFLEILFFGSLFFLSFRLSSQKNANRHLRQGLIFLTLIVTAEFLETLGQNIFDYGASPVVNFLIQVALAGAIFPLERYVSYKMKVRSRKAASTT